MKAVTIFLFLVAFTFAAPSFAQSPPTGLSTIEMSGTIGTYRVGLNVSVRDSAQFAGGHYFYASRLANIPLTGRVDGETVTLTEPGGGVFHLHLVTNAATTDRPLSFYTSTGLVGTWTSGSATLPVSLGIETVYPGMGPTPWYGDVTTRSDAAFETMVRHFLHGALTGNRQEAAQAVSFPLRVNGEKRLIIRSKSSFYAHWNDIFTPTYLAVLRNAIPHEMFVRDGQAMVGNGAAWFGAKGATS